MNLKFAKYLIITLLLASCGKQETEIKNYGFPKNERGSLNLSLELSEFKNYGKLIDRIREITCNDSIPKLVIKEKKIIKGNFDFGLIVYSLKIGAPIVINQLAGYILVFFDRLIINNEQCIISNE